MKSFSMTQAKAFMEKLLVSDFFDSFLLEEATISTYNTFIIDGHILPDFFTEEEPPQSTFSSWRDIRPLCFQLIKGSRTPLNFKFVLHLATADIMNLVDITPMPSFILTVKFDGTSITLTTGTCYQTFSLDKSAENTWDNYMKDFLLQGDFSFEDRN